MRKGCMRQQTILNIPYRVRDASPESNTRSFRIRRDSGFFSLLPPPLLPRHCHGGWLPLACPRRCWRAADLLASTRWYQRSRLLTACGTFDAPARTPGLDDKFVFGWVWSLGLVTGQASEADLTPYWVHTYIWYVQYDCRISTKPTIPYRRFC